MLQDGVRNHLCGCAFFGGFPFRLVDFKGKPQVKPLRRIQPERLRHPDVLGTNTSPRGPGIGKVYRGQFCEDCMSGEGRMQWRDGGHPRLLKGCDSRGFWRILMAGSLLFTKKTRYRSQRSHLRCAFGFGASWFPFIKGAGGLRCFCWDLLALHMLRALGLYDVHGFFVALESHPLFHL